MKKRKILPVAIWTVGIFTILASSLEEERPVVPPVPVVVDFTLSSLATPLSREIDTRLLALDDLILSGEYRANQGEKLTLDRSSVTLSDSSRFVIAVTATDPDELLDGTGTFAVGAALDVGIDHNPAAGQFTVLFNDVTTTIVTVTGGGVDVVIGDGPTQSFSWAEFEAREDDSDEAIELRMASAAYNMIDTVLRSGLLVEAIIDDVEINKTTLESMGIDPASALSLTCDNTASQGTGEAVLLWTVDDGSGSIGSGDGFEARYENCRNAANNRFLENNVVLSSYNPADSSGLSSFGVNADFRDLFVAETETNDLTTTPTAESPRINGQLSLLYFETATTQ